MSISPLLPIALPYLGEIASQTVKNVIGGLEFAHALLADAPSEQQPPGETEGSSHTTELMFDLTDVSSDGFRGVTLKEDSKTSHPEALKRLREFHRLLTNRLRDVGIDANRPLAMVSDIFGEIDQVQAGSDDALIRDAIARDPVLRQAFHDLAVFFSGVTPKGEFPLLQASRPRDGKTEATVLPPLRLEFDDDRAKVIVAH